MDTQSIVVLSIQLVTLFSIASALLLYLLWKVKGTRSGTIGPQNGTILITSAETALGLQLCTHFANRGCRVFAGMNDPKNSLPAKLLRKWVEMRDFSEKPLQGIIIPIKLNVNREDVLRNAAEIAMTHLNVGERGISAVINTAGCVYRGNFEQQDSKQWESVLKTNILGSMRVARIFLNLLLPTRGRIIFLGSGSKGDGLVAYITSRIAIEGCVEALRDEFKPFGVDIVSLDTDGLPAETLFNPPSPFAISDGTETNIQYSTEILSPKSISTIEHALFDPRPHYRYHLTGDNLILPLKMPSFKRKSKHGMIQYV